jgi:quinoprotein glucose dehydrogenase
MLTMSECRRTRLIRQDCEILGESLRWKDMTSQVLRSARLTEPLRPARDPCDAARTLPMESSMKRLPALLFGLALSLILAATSRAQDKLYEPSVAHASSEPEGARQAIRHPDDVTVSLFAAEPRLANPVTFAVDPKGRFFVVETFRLNAGVTDNRGHMYWLDDDLASRTVADREALYKKWLGKEIGSYSVEHDRIRLIEDRDGDGRADFDTVFADGFKNLASGIGSGVLARKEGVYFACIPDLWLLKDSRGTGHADQRSVLSTGYGVHVSFLGHDLHGLIMGPDGRLYFTIGDRGLNVVNREGKNISCPDTGAVLRCEPDGTNLELFATGLRNPQELAFDNYGNLFTVDNNSDSGDKARVVHVVEGGDSGWRIGYQYIENPVSRGPWNAEKLWYPAPQNTAAYLLPPLMNLSDGPSGLTFDPGVTQLPSRFKDHFFLADFRGGHAQSGIDSFAVEPKGASFRVVDAQQPFWSVLATDVDFGPDGALYVTDWVDGWNKTGKGRIWKFGDPKRANDPALKEVKKLIAESMSGRTDEELGVLLGHADRRVRQAAQFELADRLVKEQALAAANPGGKLLGVHESSLAVLSEILRGRDRMARIQSLWALGQVIRQYQKRVLSIVMELRSDPDPEIRAQVVKILGETPTAMVPRAEIVALLVPLLHDASPRVQSFAAQALGKHGESAAVAPLLALLEANADKDPYLRHAAVYALARIGDMQGLVDAGLHQSPAVRLGALLALRRLDPNTLGPFLKDASPQIVLEAARGIYDDDPKPGPGMEALAALAMQPKLDVPTLRRALNANARLGGSQRAETLVQIASRADAPAPVRMEALELLGDWAKPSGRDRISGLWRPFAARPKREAITAFHSHLDSFLKSGSEDIRRAGIATIGNLGVADSIPALITLIDNEKVPGRTRVEALRAIEKMGDPRLVEAVAEAIEAVDHRVRAEGQRLLGKTDPVRALPLLATVMTKGTLREKQGALDILADLARPEADALIAEHLKVQDSPVEIELDLLEAGYRRTADPAVRAALNARIASQPKNDPLAGYRSTLYGGDETKGSATFEKNTAVYCIRCHKVKGQGGEVGPDLTGVGKRQTREYLATSVVHPNAAIAQGFETVVVSLNDGRIISGVFKSEDAKTLRLVTVEGKPIDVSKALIEERQRGPSAMPDDVAKKLSRFEVRDLVEFLSSLR